MSETIKAAANMADDFIEALGDLLANQVPDSAFTVEKDEDGVWCAEYHGEFATSALGSSDEGAEEAIYDARTGLSMCIAVAISEELEALWKRQAEVARSNTTTDSERSE